MAKHIVCNTGKLQATYGGAHLLSVRANIDLDNGMIVAVKQLVEGEQEIYEVATPTDGDAVVLIKQDELIYDTSSKSAQDLYNFYNPAGLTTRAYELKEGFDTFDVSDYAITPLATAVVKGNLVVHDGTCKFKELAKGTDTAIYGFVGEIVFVRKLANETQVAIRVIKNRTVTA